MTKLTIALLTLLMSTTALASDGGLNLATLRDPHVDQPSTSAKEETDMGNFKIEIEAVGGHGVCRDIKQGEVIPYDTAHANEPDVQAKRFVEEFGKTNNVLSAKLTHWPDTTPIVDNLKTGVREHGDFTERWQGEEMLVHFEFQHLPEGAMRETSRLFNHLAYTVVRTLPRSAERTVALRKLLEGKDAAVRAARVKT